MAYGIKASSCDPLKWIDSDIAFLLSTFLITKDKLGGFMNEHDCKLYQND